MILHHFEQGRFCLPMLRTIVVFPCDPFFQEDSSVLGLETDACSMCCHRIMKSPFHMTQMHGSTYKSCLVRSHVLFNCRSALFDTSDDSDVAEKHSGDGDDIQDLSHRHYCPRWPGTRTENGLS